MLEKGISEKKTWEEFYIFFKFFEGIAKRIPETMEHLPIEPLVGFFNEGYLMEYM